MLPGATVGLLFGVWLFQQQPRLWSLGMWLCWLLVLTLAGLLACRRQSVGSRFYPYSPVFRKLFVLLLIAALGFAWGQLRAWHRLQAQLTPGCEQQVIAVEGVIVGVPERDARGQHVDFAIERSFKADCPLPERVRLHLYQQSYRGASPTASPAFPLLNAGERWQWSVRLKRPHATRNPHGFDYAA